MCAAVAVAALFYASFGTHPAGLRDAIVAYDHAWTRATGDTGHEKPWWYYLRLFAWQRTGGLVFEQLAFSALAVVGMIGAATTKQPLLRWASVYTVVIVAVLSLTPYKTPWHVVHFVPGLALLAAGAIDVLPNWRVAAVLIGAALALQTAQAGRVAFAYPADERNPYAYVHASPDVLKFRPLAEAALAHTPAQPVRIVSEEYWPLPWYLRGLPRVGYWSTPPGDCDGALVIASVTQADAVRAKLHDSYRE